jgi:nitroreductase
MTQQAALAQPDGRPSIRTPDSAVDDLFVSRWSRRSFSDRPVTRETLQTLFEAARWAPSASNAQPWLFVYHDDAESLATARALLNPNNQRWAAKAPVLIFVFARRTNPETGKPLRTGGFDTGAAWLSLALQAHKLGLVTRAMGGINHDGTYEAFGVPREDYESMAAVALGYPGRKEDLPPDIAERESPTTRKPVSSFAFAARFQPR